MNPAIEKVKSQMRKGILEYCILLILHKQQAYSADIINILKGCKLIVVEGTLYPLLSRLKKENLLSYTWVESNQGPPRKYYKITEEGESFLGELGGVWDEICVTMEQLRDVDRLRDAIHEAVSDPFENQTPIDNVEEYNNPKNLM